MTCIIESMIKAVILDFGGTLSEIGKIGWASWHSKIIELLKRRGINVDKDSLIKAIDASGAALDEIQSRNEDITFKEMYADVMTRLGIAVDEDTLEEINEVFHELQNPVLYPCVEEVLRALSRRYKVAVLANTISEVPHICLSQFELRKYIDLIVCTGELHIRKPSPKAFRYVLEKLGVKPEEAVHVGNTFKTDILGAIETGITPIWINREEKETWSGYKIESICDLPEKLNEIESI